MSAMVSPGLSLWSQTFQNSGVLTASKFIRKMKGGGQSLLVQTDEHQFVVVKMVGNPQGPNVLANEVLGGAISSAAGIPVPQGRLIYISEDFIDQNPGAWFETPKGRVRPEPGLHFGSLFVGEIQGWNRPTEYISRSRVQSIQNRQLFLGMYIIDVWANHQDNRQALLVPSSVSRELEVRFIDHGHMFAGPHWIFSKRLGLAPHLERSVYSDLWEPFEIARWISHLENVLPNALSLGVSLIPRWWYNGNVDLLHTQLLRRLSNLAELVENDRLEAPQEVRRSTTNDTLQLPHLGVHMFGAPA